SGSPKRWVSVICSKRMVSVNIQDIRGARLGTGIDAQLQPLCQKVIHLVLFVRVEHLRIGDFTTYRQAPDALVTERLGGSCIMVHTHLHGWRRTPEWKTTCHDHLQRGGVTEGLQQFNDHSHGLAGI